MVDGATVVSVGAVESEAAAVVSTWSSPVTEPLSPIGTVVASELVVAPPDRSRPAPAWLTRLPVWPSEAERSIDADDSASEEMIQTSPT